MNILFIIPSYKPAYVYGGTIVAVAELAEALAAQGNNVTIYTTTANGKTELDVPIGTAVQIDGVDVFYFTRVTGDHTHVSPMLWKKLRKEADKFDVVHLHSWWSLLMIGAAMICRMKKVRYILSPHGMLSNYTFAAQNSTIKNLLHKTIGKRLLTYSYLHATTRLEWEECLKINGNWKGFITYNLINLPEAFKDVQPLNDAEEVMTLVYLSRIDQKKGLEILFSALSEVDIDYRLKIAGSGDEGYINSLKALSKNLSIEGKIEWCGWKQGQEKFTFLSKADLFVLTSHNENFAIAVLEALSMGTPVLISRKVGLSDYILESQQGWVCDLDKESVKSNLVSAYQQRSRRFRIRDKAPQKIQSDFNKANLARQYLLNYQNLFSKPKSGNTS